MIGAGVAHIPDIAVVADTACQKCVVIDGQVQMIKCCLRATTTPTRCLKYNTNVIVCQGKIKDIVNLGSIGEVIQNVK